MEVLYRIRQYFGSYSLTLPLHRPYIGLIHGRYLQFGFPEWPLALIYLSLRTSKSCAMCLATSSLAPAFLSDPRRVCMNLAYEQNLLRLDDTK